MKRPLIDARTGYPIRDHRGAKHVARLRSFEGPQVQYVWAGDWLRLMRTCGFYRGRRGVVTLTGLLIAISGLMIMITAANWAAYLGLLVFIGGAITSMAWLTMTLAREHYQQIADEITRATGVSGVPTRPLEAQR